RNLPCAAGTEQHRKTWCCRRRSNWYADGVPCHPFKPGFFGVVVGVDVDDLRIPVGFLAGNVVAALKDQKSLSGWRQVISESSTTRAGSDDDHVVVIVAHDANPPFAPQKMQRLSLLWWSLQHFTASCPFRHRKSSAANSMPSGGAVK